MRSRLLQTLAVFCLTGSIATATFAQDISVATPAAQPETPTDVPKLIVIVGADGAPEYAPQFRQWAERWAQAAKRGNAERQIIGLRDANSKPSEGVSDKTDHEAVQAAIEAHAANGTQPLWIVLIGHGTFDGKVARFNLKGADLSSKELSQWIGKIHAPLAVINCTASSGPFLAELSGSRRVIITATRSGSEHNFAHFGDFLSTAISDPSADLDKDDQTSLFEAYLKASSMLREFYAENTRLATEHALLDDNGDRLGTPADWFQGLRLVKSAKTSAAVDGDLARQFVLVRSQSEQVLSPASRAQRDDLERQLTELRQRKNQMSETDYLTLVEPLLIQLAKLSQSEIAK